MWVYKHKGLCVVLVQSILLLFLLSACTTGSDLQKRKYRRGYYFSKNKTDVSVKEHWQTRTVKSAPESPMLATGIELNAITSNPLTPGIIPFSAKESARVKDPQPNVNTPVFYSTSVRRTLQNKNTGYAKQASQYAHLKKDETAWMGILGVIIILALAIFFSLLILMIIFFAAGNTATGIIFGSILLLYSFCALAYIDGLGR